MTHRACSQSGRSARRDVLLHHLDEVRVFSEEEARRAVEHGEHGQVALRRLLERTVQRGGPRA